MPDPTPSPDWPGAKRVGLRALIGGVALMALKLVVFAFTGSAAVLSDALESVVNIGAASAALYTLWLSSQPPDKRHPYGHGKAEFLAVALEGSLVTLAGALIVYESLKRLFGEHEVTGLNAGIWGVAIIGVCQLALGAHVLRAGRSMENPVLIADGKHLLTDVVTTGGALIGLVLVKLTGLHWLDPIVALLLAGAVVWTGWRLLMESIEGLMDAADPAAMALARGILEKAQDEGRIRGFHKLRLRRTGRFCWADVHLQLPGSMTVAESHDIASRIEHEIERALAPANASAHVEPEEENLTPAPSSP